MTEFLKKLWDETPADPEHKFVPDGQDMIAVIKDAGIHIKEETGYHGVFFKMYFPAYNLEEISFDSIRDSEMSIRILKSKLSRLGVLDQVSEGTLPEIESAVKATIGYTIKVSKKTSKRNDGGVFRNYYINSVVSKEAPVEEVVVPEEDLPF